MLKSKLSRKLLTSASLFALFANTEQTLASSDVYINNNVTKTYTTSYSQQSGHLYIGDATTGGTLIFQTPATVSSGSSSVSMPMTSATTLSLTLGSGNLNFAGPDASTNQGLFKLDSTNGPLILNIALSNNGTIASPLVANRGTFEFNANGYNNTLNTGNVAAGSAASPIHGVQTEGSGNVAFNAPLFARGIDANGPITQNVTYSQNVNIISNPTASRDGIVMINGTSTNNFQGNLITQGANQNAPGIIYFAGDGIINMSTGTTLTANVISADGNEGTVAFLGTGTWNGGTIFSPGTGNTQTPALPTTNTGFKKLLVGAGNFSLSANTYNIGEIQGNGTNTLTLPSGFNSTGGVNLSGGQALNLVFGGASTIGSSIGTAPPVAGSTAIDNGISLTNTNPIGNLRLGTGNLIINGGLAATGVNYTATPATLTVTGPVILSTGGIATSGTGDVLAVGGSFYTGTGTIGTSANPLTVRLLNKNNIYVNTTNFNANVTTANNNQGIANLNVANGVVTGSVGDTTNALGTVNFNASETITGQVFANQINVAQSVISQFNNSINYNPANTNVTGSMILSNNAKAVFAGNGTYIRIPILSSAQGAGNGRITIADNTTGVRFQGPIGGSPVGNTPANTLAISNIIVGANSQFIPDSSVVLRYSNNAAIALANGASLAVDPLPLGNQSVVRTIVGVYGTEYISAAGNNLIGIYNGGQLKLQGITIGQAASGNTNAAPVSQVTIYGSLETNRDINATATTLGYPGDSAATGRLILDGDGTSVNSAINVNGNIVINASGTAGATSSVILNTAANSSYNFNGTLALNDVNSKASDNVGNFTINTGSFTSTVSSPNNSMNIGISPTQRLSQFNITGSGNIVVNPAVYAANINSSSTGSVTYNGLVNTGASGLLTYNASGTTNFNANATTGINFNNYNSTINVAPNQVLTGNVTSAGGSGIISLGQNANWIGNTTGAGFAKLLVTGNSSLASGTYNIGEIQGQSSTPGNLGLGNGFILNGGINTSGGAALNIIFAGNGTINGNIGSGSSVGTIYITDPSGSVILLNGAVTAQGITYASQNETLQIAGNLNSPVQFNGSGNILALSGSNTTVNGNISGSGGIVRVLPNVTNVIFNSPIGNPSAIALLDLQTGSSANLNADASFDGSSNVNRDSGGSSTNTISGINIGNGATLNLAAGKNISAINGASIIFNNLTSTLNVVGNANTVISAPITLHSDNSGMIIANGIVAGNSLTINGNIGNNNSHLDILQARGGGSVILNGNAYITTLDIVGNNSTVELGGNSTYLFTNFLHNNNQGQLVVDQNAIIASLSNISTPTDRISGITLKNDSSLALGDGVNIYTSSNGINGSGNLILLGNAIIDAPIGNSAKIGNININGAFDVNAIPETATFYQDINANNINVNNNITVQFGGNIRANGIVTHATNTTLEFINSQRVDVYANVGVNNNPIGTFRITDASVSAHGNFKANNIDFNNPNVVSALYLLGGTDLGSTNVTTNSDIRAHNIHVNGDQHITGSIGSANNLFGSVTLENDSTITVDTTNFYAAVRSVKDGEGTVIFTKDGSRGYQLGRSVDALDTANLPSNSLKAILFNANTTSYGVARATNIYIAADKTATFNSGFNLPGENTIGGQAISGAVISSGGVYLKGTGSNIIIGYGTLLEAAVYTDVKNTGNITFNGGSKTFNNIGTADARLNSIIFNQSSVSDPIKINGSNSLRNFNANNIISNGAAIKLNRDLTLNGSFTVNDGTNIDLGDHRLILSSGNSVFNGNINLNTLVDNGKFGHIDVTGNGTILDLSQASAINIVVDANTFPNSFSSLLFLEQNGGKISLAANNNINVTSANRFLMTAYDPSNRMLTIGSVSNSVISQDLNNIMAGAGLNGSNAAAIGQAFANEINDPTVQAIIFGLGSMTDEVVAEALSRLESFNGAQVIANNVNISNVNNRIQAIDNPAGTGDDAIEYGLWASPLYGYARQNKTSKLMSYKVRTNGITVGIDASTNEENTLVGAAYTYAHTDTKLRGMKIGDNSKINSSIFSLYGSHKFCQDWFMQGIASVGFGKVHNSETRIINSTQTMIAKSNPHITNVDVEADLGYKYRLTRNFSVTPMIGGHYFNSPKVRYNEKGAGVQNLSVHYKAQNNFELRTGAKLDLKYNIGQAYLTPEVYGFVNYNTNNKRPSADIKLLGTNFNLPIQQDKANRVWFNLGTNMNFNKGMMEYSLNYDIEFKKKYIAQQGSITIKAKL